MKKTIRQVAVIGDGGWGTTLGVLLARKGIKVTIWGPFADYLKQMRASRVNAKFLPGIKLPPQIAFESDLKKILLNPDLILFAIPSKFAPQVIKQMRATGINFNAIPVLSVTKGIDTKSSYRISQLMAEGLGRLPLAVLSGPTIAMEVAKGVPSTAVIASKNNSLAKILQKLFNSESFRIYTNNDVAGLEIGGSVKNVIAIACGVCDGLGFGTNTKAAILTRGLAEMTRLGKRLGANQTTFFGLSGLGDLITTSFNEKSRNRTVGEQLGRGKTIRQITAGMEMVAEGVETAKAVYILSRKLKIDMPITKAVYEIVHENKKAGGVVAALMSRKPKPE